MPDPVEEWIRIMAQNNGAQTDREIEQWGEMQRQLDNSIFTNFKIKFIEVNDHRELQIIILAQDSTDEMYYDHIPRREEIAEHGYVVDHDGLVIRAEHAISCDFCGDVFWEDNIEHIEDTDQYVCRKCRSRNSVRCDHCSRLFSDIQSMEEVYSVDDDCSLGEWCEECRDRENTWWDDEAEREYYERNVRMQQYLKPEGVLAFGCERNCHECQDAPEGICAKHRIEQVKEMEKEATTLWVYDTLRRNYHERGHDRFKKLKYRMPNEHPYLYYGIEKEVIWDANKGSYDRVCKEFIEATGGLFIAEYDSSVDRAASEMGHYIGAEFISRPVSYKRWMDKDTITKLENGMRVLRKYGAQDPQTDGCGLHVHMSKAFFEKNTIKKVKDIKEDMDWFFQFFQPEIEKFARRQYTQYCASKAYRFKHANDDARRSNQGNPYFGIKGKIQLEKSQMTISQGSGITHHDCVIETPKTIEARVFRSTINVEEILATIEFCRGLAHTARKRTGLTGRTFGEILFSKDDNYLSNYVRKIRLDTSRKLGTKLEIKL